MFLFLAPAKGVLTLGPSSKLHARVLCMNWNEFIVYHFSRKFSIPTVNFTNEDLNTQWGKARQAQHSLFWHTFWLDHQSKYPAECCVCKTAANTPGEESSQNRVWPLGWIHSWVHVLHLELSPLSIGPPLSLTTRFLPNNIVRVHSWPDTMWLFILWRETETVSTAIANPVSS